LFAVVAAAGRIVVAAVAATIADTAVVCTCLVVDVAATRWHEARQQLSPRCQQYSVFAAAVAAAVVVVVAFAAVGQRMRQPC